MIKLFLIFSLIILIIASAVYFFIPSNQPIDLGTTINCTESGLSRIMLNKNKWRIWWPGYKKADNLYGYKHCIYRIDKIAANGFETTIFNGKDSTKATLQIIGLDNGSIELRWKSFFSFSDQPVKKILQFNRYTNIKNNIEALTASIKNFFDREENIYGIKVIKQKVTEASLISTKQDFNHYPSAKEVYSMITLLKEYIRQKGGEEDSYPMLNVHTEDSLNYQAMVAIPTKTDLPSEGKFALKKMVLGNILMAEVKGGIYTVKNGEQELTNYVNDYNKISPAIPFQSLVTNRIQEADTSKWVTKLYYPIFN
jgi:hypothetical protein